MKRLAVKIYPSDLSHDEKEQRLREALELLLRPIKSDEKEAAAKQRINIFGRRKNKATLIQG